MNRRSFGLLAGTSLAALKFSTAYAQSAPDASLLKTTLTPLGSTRAGNADGSIPAWTGGYNTPPAGWTPGQFVPDPYISDAVLVKIDANNMAQYTKYLTTGAMALMQKYPDFSIDVYPTHRTACAPQDVYDNIAANVGRAQLSPNGPQTGFANAVGGIPFPILDTSDPLKAGGQCIWNNYAAWRGRAFKQRNYDVVIANGGAPYIAGVSNASYDLPFYHKDVTPETFSGLVLRSLEITTAPPNVNGEQYLTKENANPVVTPNRVWELLPGQGRVRMAPDISYDTPSPSVDGLANVDEYFGFADQPDRYDWHYQGVKELFIPYNNNTLFGVAPETACLPRFVDPKYVRWEKHRVHVLEAQVRPGARETFPRRMFYLDEDTYTIAATDAYDANGALAHVGFVYFITRPDVPGTMLGNNVVHNLQTGDYAVMSGLWDEQAHPSLTYLDGLPDSIFTPANMAASAQF